MKVNIDFSKKESKNYSIFIEPLQKIKLDKKIAIITNPKVSGLHLKKLLDNLEAKEIYIVTVPDGENYKNFETLNFILERLFDHKLDRKSVLIAFGGGVIGDMSGFAASVFQRGIEFIQIPTTLLSQVDASVGGKTGINNRFGKNLVGAFHQPSAVYIDIDFLKTLPKREFSAGIAEIVKMAVTFDRDFFKWLENANLNKDEDLSIAIKKSIETKAWVVSQDEKEKGIRAVLNYGHTFAHVIENLTNYTTYLHGEAVAIGMVMANRLSVELGLLDEKESKRIENILKRYDLPTKFEIECPNTFYEHLFLDKKSMDSKIKFILPKGIGGFEMRDDIDKNIIIKLLQQFNRG